MKYRLDQFVPVKEFTRTISEQLARVERGEGPLVLTRHGKPVAIVRELDIDPAATPLKGQDLADQVVKYFAHNDTVHYKVLMQRLRGDGFVPAGTHPIDNLLAVLSRDERIEAVGSRTGRYRLRSE